MPAKGEAQPRGHIRSDIADARFRKEHHQILHDNGAQNDHEQQTELRVKAQRREGIDGHALDPGIGDITFESQVQHGKKGRKAHAVRHPGTAAGQRSAAHSARDNVE